MSSELHENIEHHDFRETDNVQLLTETESKVKHSSEIAETSFSDTLESIRDKYSESIPVEQEIRMDAEQEIAMPHVLSVEEYHNRFPELDITVAGHCNAEGNIYLKEGNDDVVRHVTTHETMHFASFREINADAESETVYRCGLRETRLSRTGEITDQNRGINEGFTELYTLRELGARGDDEAVTAFVSYPEAQGYAIGLESAVGRETVERAYFGGELQALKEEVTRLNYGDESAWKYFSEDVDTVEYGDDPDEVRAAKARLSIRQAIMESFKEQEQQEHFSVNH